MFTAWLYAIKCTESDITGLPACVYVCKIQTYVYVERDTERVKGIGEESAFEKRRELRR